MQQRNAVLTFAEITEADLPELTAVMTRAFDDDAQKHLGLERGGPEGYDNGDFFRRWLFGYEQTDGYKVLRDGRIVGAVIVWILPEDHNILGTIFVDPPAQDQGVGSQLWAYVEAQYPETRSWRLETPKWATKNHHFYVKCGFRRVYTDPLLTPSEEVYLFRKEMVEA